MYGQKYENSIFESVNTTIQVKVITKIIYINVVHNMFCSLLGYHRVYFFVLRCLIFVPYGSIFFFIFNYDYVSIA